MAEPATKEKVEAPVVSADEFAELKALVDQLAKDKDEAEADNAELRELVAEVKRQAQSPARTPEDDAELQNAQDIVDFISGSVYPTEVVIPPGGGEPDENALAKAEKGKRLEAMKPPTRMEVVGAIKVIRADLRRKLAAKRDIEPEELKTMTNGLRAHIASLNECAEVYYEREDI